MARKRTYKAENINPNICAKLRQLTRGHERIVVGLDVAKKTQFAAFMTSDNDILAIVKFDSPHDNNAFIELLCGIEACVEVALESTGTYAEALRYRLHAAGVAVNQVATKRAHDAAELYDGVPSMHDGKASAVLAWLHRNGYSSPWPPLDEHARRMRALASRSRQADLDFQRRINQLEARLAAFWPELTLSLSLTSATLLGLLSHFASAQAVAAAPEAAAELMRKLGRSFLSEAKIEAVIASAASTQGIAMVDEEVEALRELAAQADALRVQRRKLRRQLAELSQDIEVVDALSPVLGKYTALMLVLLVGDPRQFESAAAYTKAFGLNLAETSSGKAQGRLHISRRGSSYARYLLFLAALRQIKSNRIVRAWYEKRLVNNGGIKMKGVVAVMRKLTRALWQMARSGERFDARRLFDTRRLDLKHTRPGERDTATAQEAAMK